LALLPPPPPPSHVLGESRGFELGRHYASLAALPHLKGGLNLIGRTEDGHESRVCPPLTGLLYTITEEDADAEMTNL
jgi:hypothetical protein